MALFCYVIVYLNQIPSHSQFGESSMVSLAYSVVSCCLHTCRCQKSVKHYRVTWDGKQFIFGLGKFNSLEEFKEHFSHQPVISGESGNCNTAVTDSMTLLFAVTPTGVLVQLRYPYPRGVSEPAIYFEANEVDVSISEIENQQKAVAKSNKSSKLLNSLDFSVSAPC